MAGYWHDNFVRSESIAGSPFWLKLADTVNKAFGMYRALWVITSEVYLVVYRPAALASTASILSMCAMLM